MNISQSDVEAIRLAGWSGQTIEDTIYIVSTFAFLNRLVDGFGLESSSDLLSASKGGMVAQHDYQPLVNMTKQKAGDSLVEAKLCF